MQSEPEGEVAVVLFDLEYGLTTSCCFSLFWNCTHKANARVQKYFS